MTALIFWYLTLTILGMVSFPLVYCLFPGLTDRGYTLAKTVGLFLWGYGFWLLGVLGLLGNNLAGILFAFLLLLAGSAWALLKIGWQDLLAWVRAHWKVILVTEILFLGTFLFWGFVRANNPEIMGTEKPMELAFINAISRSRGLPPHDPWLAGYSISYYYFGYLLVSMLARVTATAGSVAFNLGNVMVFSLTATGVYGLVTNLYAAAFPPEKRANFPLAGLLGPFFTLIVSNWEGFLHWLHARGVFWRMDESGQMVSAFWQWLDIKDLNAPPTENPFGHWWWWRASRVIQDYDYNGVGKEVISEFPFFSYLLGDLHAHVLAMPFAFVCLSLALSLFLTREDRRFRWLGVVHMRLSALTFGGIALFAGGMFFLNAWDFPIHVAVLAGAYALRNMRQDELSEHVLKRVLGDFLVFGITVGITGGVLYLPFYLSFSSQAGGLIPNLIYITHGAQLWVMFGPLFVVLFGLLIYLWRKHGRLSAFGKGLKIGLGLVGLLLVALLVLTLVIAVFPPLLGVGSLEQVFLGSLGAPSLQEAFRESILRRVTKPATFLTLLALIALAAGLLFSSRKGDETTSRKPLVGSHVFVLSLVFWGAVLVLTPEFVFLKDLFGYRINTIFKFYYQAWLLWSVAGAYAVLVLLRGLKPSWKAVFAGILLVTIGMALVYPVKGLITKTSGFARPQGRTLDGAVYFERYAPDDAQAVDWLKEAPFGVIAEAVGGSYSSAARMSTYSGLPTVLGWDFHEVQWRGSNELVAPRQQDINQLYCARDWESVQPILEKYDIRYVVVGDLEYTTYSTQSGTCPNGLREGKFAENLTLAVRYGGTSIYRVR